MNTFFGNIDARTWAVLDNLEGIKSSQQPLHRFDDPAFPAIPPHTCKPLC